MQPALQARPLSLLPAELPSASATIATTAVSLPPNAYRADDDIVHAHYREIAKAGQVTSTAVASSGSASAGVVTLDDLAAGS